MKCLINVASLSVLSAGAAAAGGIDLAAQNLGILFKDGNYAEVGVTHISTDVRARDVPQAPPGFPFPYDSGSSYGDVVGDFTMYNFGVKYDLTNRFSLTVTGQEDFGSDLYYSPKTGSLLGGTKARTDTYSLAVIGRYRFTETWSVHGGVRRNTADGEIALGGLAYGAVNGYRVKFDDDVGYGYLIGAAFEIPDYALRIAVTYNSEIEHKFKSKESLSGTSMGSSKRTKVNTPQSVNIDFQTGVAEDTLLFGQIRWADWSEFTIAPERFKAQTGGGLVDLKDITTYTIGLGHRFTPAFSASASFIYEKEDDDDLLSPLSPTNGVKAVALGASYRIQQIEISGGVRYSWLGDARPETGTPDVARARTRNNEAVTVGMRIGYYF
ncbi:MAG: OmpP1/FadL family transporter [Qingshengfaniella sp.]